MKQLIAVLLLLAMACAVFAQNNKQSRKVFPYPYTIDDFPNGLRLITVPTDYPNLVSLYIVVQTGSRNEIEPGKSGYAHFFEHLMFRGSENFPAEKRDEILKRAGADSNAYTSSDRTVYHEVFSKEDLPQIMELEADRFQRLKYERNPYKTEALAVLGEYNKNSASPTSKLYEVVRETAFKKHTYAHTTMGYLKDIEDFPNQYEYSLEFFNRYYRPEYTTIVIVGDVTQAQAASLTKKYWGDWKKGNYVPQIPKEPEQTEARTAHVDWPSQTLPWVTVSFRAPAYDDASKDKAALDLLSVIAFGSNSDLYQRLVIKEQKVDVISPSFDDSFDPELFGAWVRVKKAEDMDYVREQVLETFKRYTTELIPQEKLNATSSRMRYSFALGMNSSEAINAALAQYISLRRTPETIDRMF
ncbi:MAG: insulinase family protein, partial [Pyrinomonadaceae bacterium]|nr:insulinase family protein [Pyrinomonadaceae bacterium]